MDSDYIRRVLGELLLIPSPTGATDEIVDYVAARLVELDLEPEQTRRGALRAHWNVGADKTLALSAHLDTLGAMINGFGGNGRPRLSPLGSWSARFAEGARCSVLLRDGGRLRGTLLPLKSSGHRYGNEIDNQPSRWDNLELRVDADDTDLRRMDVGDVVAVDSAAEFLDNGYINARHLDNKAAVALLLGAVKSYVDNGEEPAVNLELLFPVTEEVGTGASHLVRDHVDDLIAIDIAILAPQQNASPFGVTLVAMDAGGPYDASLLNELRRLCELNHIEHSVDVFRHYYSDCHASAQAGSDCRSALVAFACDASHAWERTHWRSLLATGQLLQVVMRAG